MVVDSVQSVVTAGHAAFRLAQPVVFHVICSAKMIVPRHFFLIACALILVSCSRAPRFTVAEIAGEYVVERADSGWAKQAGYYERELADLRVVLRLDGSAMLRNFPASRRVTGVATWSLFKPEQIFLHIADLNLNVPVGVEEASGSVVLTYSEDPEFPTNVRLKKAEPLQSKKSW